VSAEEPNERTSLYSFLRRAEIGRLSKEDLAALRDVFLEHMEAVLQKLLPRFDGVYISENVVKTRTGFLKHMRTRKFWRFFKDGRLVSGDYLCDAAGNPPHPFPALRRKL